MIKYEKYKQTLNENSYDDNKKINLLSDVLKHGWAYAIESLNNGSSYLYWYRFFTIDLRLDSFFMSSFKNVFDAVQDGKSVKPSDLWKYQVGRDPNAENKAQLRHYIAILDRNTIEHKDTIKNWIVTHKNKV